MSKQFQDIDSVATEIMTIVGNLAANKIANLGGDMLSLLVLKLAAYKAFLGGHVAELRLTRDAADMAYIKARETAYMKHRKDGENVADSQAKRRIDAEDDYNAYIDAAYQYERIHNLHNDCRDMVEAMRSRLIHLQGERRDSNIT